MIEWLVSVVFTIVCIVPLIFFAYYYYCCYFCHYILGVAFLVLASGGLCFILNSWHQSSILDITCLNYRRKYKQNGVFEW